MVVDCGGGMSKAAAKAFASISWPSLAWLLTLSRKLTRTMLSTSSGRPGPSVANDWRFRLRDWRRSPGAARAGTESRMASVFPRQQRVLSEAFFNDLHTHDRITDIARQETLVVYAGLGVTVDRTKMNWRALVDGLAATPALGLSEDQRQAIFACSGGSTIAAASIVYELFVDALGPDEAQVTVQKRMRTLLYPTTLISETGRLVAALGSLADAWARKGRTVVIVTPNYEDLLHQLLLGMTPEPVEVVHVSTSTKPEEADALLASTGIKYVYLHGSVPDTGPFVVRPVLQERDYFETETAVRGFLRRLFERSASLFVGTSLQDPPLVSADRKSVV